LSPGLPLDALWKRVGKESLGHHMVAKLLKHVGQHQIFDEAGIGKQVMLKSFHGKEQTGNTFSKNIPYLVHQCCCGFDMGTA
jgi:hypothetical protein